MKKGDTITYLKDIRFKGTETVKAKIVAIRQVCPKIQEILLDNGDKVHNLEK